MTAPAPVQPAGSGSSRGARRIGLFGLFWRLLLSLLLLVLLLLGLVLGTQSGLRAVAALAEDLAPGMVAIERVNGRLLGALEVTGLRLDLPALTLSAAQLRLDWNPGALLAGRLEVTQLAARDVDLQTAPSADDEAAEPFQLPQIRLPLELELANVLIEHFRFSQRDAAPESAIVLARAELSAAGSADLLQIRQLRVVLTQPRARADLGGEVRLSGAYPVALDLDWEFAQDPALQVRGQGQVGGDLQELTVQHQVTGSIDLTLDARVRSVLDAPAWEGDIHLRRLDLPQLVADAPPVNLDARLATSGDLRQARLTGTLSGDVPELPDAGQLAAELDLAWAEPVLEVRRLRLDETGSGATVQLTGSLDLGGAAPDFALAGTWERLRWPLRDDALAESPSGTLDLRGSPADYRYAVEADLGGAQLPAARLLLKGTGDTERTRIRSATLNTLGGSVVVEGQAGWAPTVDWDLALVAAAIDPGGLAADWPGQLGGRLETTGRLTEEGPELEARVRDFGGRLRDYPVAVEADVRLAGAAFELRQLQASSGPTRLTASGRGGLGPDEDLDLQFDFNSPDLGSLLPDARGRLATHGRIGGSPDAPQVALTLDAEGAELAGNGIARLSGNAELGLEPDAILRVAVVGTDLVAGDQRFASLNLTGNGRLSAHRLDLRLLGEPLSLTLAAVGGLADGGDYSGSLTQLTLDTPSFGDWRLQRPAPFALAAGQVSAGPLCIADGRDSGGCVSVRQPRPDSVEADLDVPRIDLGLLRPLLPTQTVVQGQLRAEARFRTAGGVLDGSARLETPTGELQLVLPEHTETLVFSGARLDVRAGDKALEGVLGLGVPGLGRLNGTLSLPGFRLTGGASQRLGGGIELRLTDLSRVSGLLPDIDGFTGTIDLDAELFGTLARPDVRGRLAVREVGFKVPLYGFELSQANLTAVSRGIADADLQGSALVGGGQLRIDGSASGGDQGVQLRVDISGDNMTVANSKEYFAVVSTALELGFGPGGGALKGEITVPEARIMPRSIPSGAITPSADVVLESTATQQEAMPFHVDLLARLGDQVLVEAFGLRGKLRGELRVIREPNRDLIGDGQLEVIDGTYRVPIPGAGLLTSVGKPLTIEQGIVVFAKTPLDNPGLILNAQRQGGDITAGVRVLGTLRNPKLAFFSESDPDLTQAEVTSYLVTGVPPKRNGEATNRSLSVGTYIAPKLFMEYETSLAEQADTVKLRYDLNKHIEVQTETGDSQGVDVFYKFER
ncbi:translocation/assembly module TamB [Thiohalocapsa marina]|uniref:Translocation/assembly module TamB n=1 Tax=Thiohalocapsa marina TaxID=424902 RepID=A0A5M8FLM8_9GAMM|nr:translocation/assembly module TamB domain-containing protein [Thiohalocapsa marina]KAA6185679.1 translocation/assembly module TamB [Thiohalocapsa marina]